MSSSCDVRHTAAEEQHLGGSVTQFEDLPVETTLEILSYLDFESLDRLLVVNWRLKRIIESHWATIFPAVVERDFSPAEDFVAVLRDVILPGADGGCSATARMPDSTLPRSLSPDGFQALLNFCRAVKQWELEFPGLRFSLHPEHSRSLQQHELCRLRSALYVWWRFARAFHGPMPCPFGTSNNPESRRSFMRQFSSVQIREIFDLWSTVEAAVGTRVCPAVLLVWASEGPYGNPMMSKEEATRIGWGEFSDNREIIHTMMKLPPEDLLHLLVYRHRYATKASVIRFVRLRHPRIEDSAQTLTAAIVDVLSERRPLPFPPFPSTFGFPSRSGGILDHPKPEVEALRHVCNDDAGSVVPEYSRFAHDLDRPTFLRRGRLDPNV